MKKIYFSALSIIFGLSLNAQTLTLTNHGPVNAELYSTDQCDSIFNIPAVAGTSTSVWNYASIVTHTNIVKNYSVTTAANASYPSASVMISSGSSDNNFFSPSASDYKYYGGTITINGNVVVITNTAPAIFATYPMTFGSTNTNTIGGSTNISGFAGTFTGVCSVTADGTGTLILPAKTYSSVIRVITSQTLNISSITSGTVIQTVYNYYSPSDSKFPVLNHNTSSINSSVVNQTVIVASLLKSTTTPTVTGIFANSLQEVSLDVYPNPSNSFVNFVSNDLTAKSLEVYEISGKLIETKVLVNGKLNLDVSNYSAGVYVYKLYNSNNEAVKTGKLNVTH